jgi:hypothetical protein
MIPVRVADDLWYKNGRMPTIQLSLSTDASAFSDSFNFQIFVIKSFALPK